MEKSLLTEINELVEDKLPLEGISLLAERFNNRIVFSSSLAFEDQVITHLIFSNDIPVKIFTIDTGRLFPETYTTLYKTNEFYGRKISVYFPSAEKVEKLVNDKGPLSFYDSIDNRLECCHIRKVEPLNRALKGMECWITGIRAEQSPDRNSITKIEWDQQRNIIKYHPILDWSTGEVKDFIRRNNVPYNPMHDKGFISIGCAPCTRAVQDGEDFRAGRWWWEDNSKKECGLHIHQN